MSIKWTKEQLDQHIVTNVDDYGAMIVVAFLYKKLYGVFPKCGMSGAQAEFADAVIEHLPESARVIRLEKALGDLYEDFVGMVGEEHTEYEGTLKNAKDVLAEEQL